jgi:hypothetical protein
MKALGHPRLIAKAFPNRPQVRILPWVLRQWRFSAISGYFRGRGGSRAVPSDDLGEYIKKIVDAAPPFTPEQRARLRVLLSPAAMGPRTNHTTSDGSTVEFRFQPMSARQPKK